MYIWLCKAYINSPNADTSCLPSLCQTQRHATVFIFMGEALHISLHTIDSKNVLLCTAHAYAAIETNPEQWQWLAAGNFAVTKSNTPFTSISVGQAQEHDNKTKRWKVFRALLPSLPLFWSTVKQLQYLPIYPCRPRRCLDYPILKVITTTRCHLAWCNIRIWHLKTWSQS
jgi:hypothetical protein